MLRHSTTRAGLILRGFSRFLNWLMIGALLLVGYMAFNTFTTPKWHRGEFGADLRLLTSYYTPPRSPGESNYVIDMLRNGHFREFLKIHGLTNNNALFVLSHGKALSTASALRYAYYPDEHVLASARVPYFSARDLAQIIGPREAKTIRNVILAGCNVESAFDAAEIRKYFVNATNITHTPPGKNGYEFVFRHGLIYTSEGVKFFYQMPDTFTVGQVTETPPAYQRKASLSPYVAELFEPQKLKPYKTQLAGRELLGAAPLPPMLAGKTSARSVSHGVSPLSVPLPGHVARQAEPDAFQAKPIIMVGAGVRNEPSQAQPARLTASCSPINLWFPSPWGELVVNGMLALVLFRVGLHCLSLAAHQPRQKG